MKHLTQLLRTIVFTLAFFSLTLGIFPVMAQIGPVDSNDCTALGINCTGSEDSAALKSRVSTIVNVFLSLLGMVAAIFIVYGGVKYITSMGEPKDAEAGKRIIVYAVIGLIIVGLSGVLVNFVINRAIG